MLAALASVTITWTAPFASPLPLDGMPVTMPRRRTTLPRADGAPSLREQMKAYLKSVQERGVELTPDQKQMIAEFEDDDELLDQTGRVDFLQGAEVMTQEDFEKQQQQEAQAAPAQAQAPPPPAPAPMAASPSPVPPPATPPAPVVVPVPVPVPVAAAIPDSPVDPTTARMWMMQAAEVDSACQLLRKADGGNLAPQEAKELRKLLASLTSTLAAAA